MMKKKSKVKIMAKVLGGFFLGVILLIVLTCSFGTTDDAGRFSPGKIGALEEFVKIHPDNIEAFGELAYVYAMKGMYDEAIGEFKKILEIIPNHIAAQNGLKYAYAMEGMEAKVEGCECEDLKAEVSLAKEIAVAAAIRANQALEETRELAQQTEEKIAMLTAKVEGLTTRVENLEE